MSSRRKKEIEQMKRNTIKTIILIAIILIIGFICIKIINAKKIDTNIYNYCPEGYHVQFTQRTVEVDGETLTDSCNKILDEYNMREFITTDEYINVVMDFNNIHHWKDYKFLYKYSYPVIIKD